MKCNFVEEIARVGHFSSKRKTQNGILLGPSDILIPLDIQR